MPPRPYIIAHRGTSGRRPENTLPAFQHAIAAGADWIEFDVTTTQDGVVVISHDTSVDRCTNGTGKIASMTLEQVQCLDAGVRFDSAFSGVRIPTLIEAIDFFESQSIRLCIEIKGDTTGEFIATAHHTIEVLQQRRFLQRVVISSFNPDCLHAIKAWEPLIATGLDPDRQDGSYTAWQLCQQVLRCHANFLMHRHETLTSEIVDEAHLHGFCLWTWTVNTIEDMRRVLPLDVDAVMSDYPDTLRQMVDSTRAMV